MFERLKQSWASRHGLTVAPVSPEPEPVQSEVTVYNSLSKEEDALAWLKTVHSSVSFNPFRGKLYVTIYIHETDGSRILGKGDAGDFLSAYSEARSRYETEIATQAKRKEALTVLTETNAK